MKLRLKNTQLIRVQNRETDRRVEKGRRDYQPDAHGAHSTSATSSPESPRSPRTFTPHLFGTEEGGKAMIAFLEETKACFKPGNDPFDPG